MINMQIQKFLNRFIKKLSRIKDSVQRINIAFLQARKKRRTRSLTSNARLHVCVV